MSIYSDYKAAAEEAQQDLWDAAAEYDRDPKIYLHWTAAPYGMGFDDYHFCIDADGNIEQMAELAEHLPHTYMRNSGAVGIALECCDDATSNDLGAYPPTDKQIDAMAELVAGLADGLGIPIDKEHVMTHGEAADNEDGLDACDPYGPLNGCTRWDLEYLGTDESPCYNPRATNGSRGGDVLRGKALWFQQKRRDK